MFHFLRRRGHGKVTCKSIADKINEINGHTVAEVIMPDRLPRPNTDGFIRWGCTTPINDGPIINTARAISTTYDKGRFRSVCAAEGIAPRTWINIDDIWEQDITVPLLLRPAHHMQGKGMLKFTYDVASNTYVSEGPDDLDVYEFIAKHPEYYISEYIEKSAEFRVFVIAGRVVAVMSKTPPENGGVAWNHAAGGKGNNVKFGDWPIDVVRVACRALELSGLHFGAVDVMVGNDGKAYVCEVNTAPEVTSPYRIECIAKAFLYHFRNGFEVIPLTKGNNWKNYIHPAVSDKAA